MRRAVAARGWQRIDPATRTFQALRIWVNRELDGLDSFLGQLPRRLQAGRTAGPDRVSLARGSRGETHVPRAALGRRAGGRGASALQVLTKHPVIADATPSSAAQSAGAQRQAARRGASSVQGDAWTSRHLRIRNSQGLPQQPDRARGRRAPAARAVAVARHRRRAGRSCCCSPRGSTSSCCATATGSSRCSAIAPPKSDINRHLRLEMETLRAPQRIEKLATERLGMVAPGDGRGASCSSAWLRPSRPPSPSSRRGNRVEYRVAASRLIPTGARRCKSRLVVAAGVLVLWVARRSRRGWSCCRCAARRSWSRAPSGSR